MTNQRQPNLAKLCTVELPTATFVEMECDVVKIYYKDVEDEIDLETAIEHTKAICELRNNKPCYIILNFLNVNVVFSNQARDHFATDPNYSAIRLSQAMVIEGLAQKIVANFYRSFHKPSCPVEFFSNEKDAIEWTLSLQT